jgi:hypothetical protein
MVSVGMHWFARHDATGATWAPREPIEVEGVLFVPVRSSDRKLAAFCGIPGKASSLTNYSWVDDLRRQRNKEVRRVTEEVLRARAPDGRVGDVRKDAKHLEGDALPKTVSVCMPAVDKGGEQAEAVLMRMLLERNPNKVVCIEATQVNVEHMRAAVRASRREIPVRKRRTRQETTRTEIKHVYVNYQRSSLITRYQDADGRNRSKSYKVASLDEEDNVKAVAASLNLFREEHNRNFV